ncbi:hypothetical protein TELCIR_13841 [Teladorsagia circumcincta]|uniref:Uncharacterized protein n=1 Tax=Teladorsagia circumcincta TaxID=45464 RepID=A0A2G9U2Z9_TELCI|nr:hypothetical protein TELCIR_13841 [Teladorsagia circumcincta]
MLLVVTWRIVTHLFCQRRREDEVEVAETVPIHLNGKHGAAAAVKTEFESLALKQEEKHLGWMTEVSCPRSSAEEAPIEQILVAGIGQLFSTAKDWAGELISGQSLTGRFLVVLVFVLSLGSLGIYFYDASLDLGTELSQQFT